MMVSVVITTFNRKNSLKKTLDELLLDDYSPKEIIVKDAGSTDGTVELLKNYGDKIIWVSQKDEGEYFGFNEGLKMTKGVILKVMTDDDILRKGAISKAVSFFKKNPDIDILFGQAIYWRKTNNKYEVFAKTSVKYSSQLNYKIWLRERQQIASLASFIRKPVFEKIGYYSTDYLGCGDIEFFVRAGYNNCKFGVIDDIFLDYYYTGENNVIKLSRTISKNIILINNKYGTKYDVFLAYLRKYFKPYSYIYIEKFFAFVFDKFNIHPRRLLRNIYFKYKSE
jgi:glycosyltransferase involved in cell wall biosynthesis